ncbi:hypothetical protein I6F26_30115 [Ensifer sp. IC3342]|nr:hypothetical protein [Ensifer sp. BRP08]MCA1450779.1 hypothetical protein [Ensifer sp. IC3342]
MQYFAKLKDQSRLLLELALGHREAESEKVDLINSGPWALFLSLGASEA